jgi:tetratricopeptide (TPR) repeat protein
LLPVTHGGGQAKDEENALRQRAVDVAAGNPRLLEWLHGVLQERSLPVSALLAKLEQEEARFREEVLISELVDAQTPAVRHALACAALYRLPVTLAAIEALSDDPQTAQHLQTAARVGLVEIVPTNHGTTHFVSPLLETALAEELSDAERQVLAAKASQHLFEAMPDNRSEEWSQEIVRLAVLGQEQDIAVEVGDPLAAQMMNANRYREAEKLCQLVLTLGEEFRILSTLARAEQRLGSGTSAITRIERAVQLMPVDKTGLSDNLLKETAFTMGAFADILQARGQLDEALHIRENHELPVYEKLGDVREKAVTMGQIADILQARGQLDEALNIRENHELPVYEKLGDVRGKAVTMMKIAGILWEQDAATHAETVRAYLCQALHSFQTMQMPRETKWVQDRLKNTGLPCEGTISPKLFLPLHDGDVLYPEQYTHLFTPAVDDVQRQTAGLHRIDIPYFSGNKHLILWTGFHLPESQTRVRVDRRYFLDLLINSLSLDTPIEKTRVISSFPTLSQFQVDELIKVFTDEIAEFAKLVADESPIIDKLQDKTVRQWLAWEETHQ